MKRSGYSDLPLHYGTVPKWLSERMSKLGKLIVEELIIQYGKKEVIRRLSDPFWFQSLGCVLGMDWHSSGITTSVLGALKRSINPISKQLGIYICGGRGKYSRQTPDELISISERTNLDGNYLVKCSKLSAKIDNTAIQDGYNLYLHNFIVTNEGDWTVIQQGMNSNNKMARRYHWHSENVKSFVEEPHSGVVGENQGLILNLTHKEALVTRNGILNIALENPTKILPEIQSIVMPAHHEVKEYNVNLKRLGAVLAVAHDKGVSNFESLLLTNGLGPRTLQSLTLVSEVIHGTPSRFKDPARFSFAHGGKDGHPFPVPLKIYDETINVMENVINKSKIGVTDKSKCLNKLHSMAKEIENNNNPSVNLKKLIKKEFKNSAEYDGRTVFSSSQNNKKNFQYEKQLRLFH